MNALESLDALAARIAAGSGPDREIDAEFARVVCGWEPFAGTWFEPLFNARMAGHPHKVTMPALAYTDALAGPGALFAAARQLWPDAWLSIWCRPSIMKALVVRIGDNHGSHPDLCRALMLAMIAAKRAEIAGGAT